MITKDSFSKINTNKKEEKKSSYLSRLIFSTVIKILIITILFLASLIYIKQSNENKKKYEKLVYNNSLSFAKIYNVYKNYLGDVIPFKNSFDDNTKLVSDEKIIYDEIKKENNGYMLSVASNYSTFAIKSGIVIKKEKKDNYKTMITIQDKNGLNITYGCLDDVNVELYDYVEKGEVLGICNKQLYLIFEKDNKYLSYEEYL